jgi:UDP-N-acetyl-D-galactosamine dehydrogenase|tara:strand:- start:1123 stop:2352 length:1230 start_codon:yes stop_codon:yes gene_type:complete
MKIIPCIIGLGYIGLPIILNIANRFTSYGFDINKERIENLKKKIDSNKEFDFESFGNLKKIIFTNKISHIKKCNFFILCLPTPIYENKTPDLRNLYNAIKTVSKILKKDDIIFIESTVFPGVTDKLKNYLEKKTNLKNNKDFFIGYSPERINPGDKKYTLKKINKIVAIETKNKTVLKKISKVYNKISNKLIKSNNIKAAETAKVIENIQRDLNIALMNEILLICKKLKINFNEVIKLARSKWNFLNFKPGLVGGHCLPVDPHYLATIAKKNNFRTNIILTGRKINDYMSIYIIKELSKFLNKKKKTLKNSKIMIVGLTYKAGVADLRNSLSFKIFKKIKKYNNKIIACDPFTYKKIKKNYNICNKINNNKKFDVIIFLSYHKIFKKIFKSTISSKNRNNVLDPFDYYS